MRFLFSRLRLLALLSSSFILTALGQGQSAKVSVDFTIIALGDKPVNDLYYKVGTQMVALKAPAYARSAPAQYTGPSTLSFYRMDQSGGKSQPVEVSQVLLPTGSRRVLLLIVPSAGSSYTMGAVADDAGTLPLGKTRLYNATSLPLSVLCNKDKTIQLKPFEAQTVDSKDGGIVINVSQLKDGQWQAVVNNVYLVPQNQKLHLFLLANYTGSLFKGNVQMFKLFESVPAPTSGNPSATTP